MSTPALFAFYGSLRAGASGLEDIGVARHVRRIGPCVMRGALYDLGAFPALVAGPGLVLADLYTAPDPETLFKLDWYEDYEEADEANSLYLRRPVTLAHPGLQAWTYLYNRALDDAEPVPSGDWIDWTRRRHGR